MIYYQRSKKIFLIFIHVLKLLRQLNVFVSLSLLASDKGYVCPEFHAESSIDIVEGKHPILDDRMKKKKYVSNDWKMNKDETIQLITGPNNGW